MPTHGGGGKKKDPLPKTLNTKSWPSLLLAPLHCRGGERMAGRRTASAGIGPARWLLGRTAAAKHLPQTNRNIGLPNERTRASCLCWLERISKVLYSGAPCLVAVLWLRKPAASLARGDGVEVDGFRSPNCMSSQQRWDRTAAR